MLEADADAARLLVPVGEDQDPVVAVVHHAHEIPCDGCRLKCDKEGARGHMGEDTFDLLMSSQCIYTNGCRQAPTSFNT